MGNDGKSAKLRGSEFFPTTQLSDCVFMETHPTFSGKYHKSRISLGDKHPDVADTVLLHIEPSSVRGETDIAEFWYGPTELADKIPRESHEGGSYSRSVLYIKTSNPPVWTSLDNWPAGVLYDGVDIGPAPGILQDKFKMATFNGKDATIDKQASWDEDIGISISTVRTMMAVPPSGVPDATATETQAISYNQSSENIMVQSVTGPAAGQTPAYDGLELPGIQEVEIPPVLYAAAPKYAWAKAVKGAYMDYADDLQIVFSYTPAQRQNLAMKTRRRIFNTVADAQTYVDALGTGFRFNPYSQDLTIGQAWAWAGDNMITRARIRTIRTPEAIVPTAIDVTLPGPDVALGGGGDTEEGGGSDYGKTVTINATGAVPWGTWVLYDVKPRIARWGYFTVDEVYIKLPASPVP